MEGNEKQGSSDYLYGISKEEIDEPIPEMEIPKTKDTLELEKIKIGEKDKDRKEKRYFTAFRLIVGCLVMLGLIYLIDTIISLVVTGGVSALTNSIVEIIKTLLFTLSGYLFARKEGE